MAEHLTSLHEVLDSISRSGKRQKEELLQKTNGHTGVEQTVALVMFLIPRDKNLSLMARIHIKKRKGQTWVHAYNPSIGEAETSRSLQFSGQQAQLDRGSKPQASKRLSQRIVELARWPRVKVLTEFHSQNLRRRTRYGGSCL